MQQSTKLFARTTARRAHTKFRNHLRSAAHGLSERALVERDRWLLFVPVALAFGILLYFELSSEPPLTACSATAIAGILGLLGLSRGDERIAEYYLTKAILVAVCLVSIGFGIAGLRTHLVSSPVLDRQASYQLSGRVMAMEPRKNGFRIVLEALDFESLEPAATPERVRVTTRFAEPVVGVGDIVRLRAILQPPQGPLFPGGFDFARRVYFEKLGGIGFVLGRVEIVEHAETLPFTEAIADARHTIAITATQSIAAPESAVASALLTGLRANIPAKVWSDMQASGLAHLLAISGLHIGLIAGTIYLLARYGLSLIQPLALRIPIKKIGALIALVGAFGYLLLAGGTVPTQRAFMMAAIALLAVVVDRNPISMRLVAIAAIGVLLHRPESVLGASFQMSFAAVVALVAFYESRPAFLRRGEADVDLALVHQLFLYFAGITATTLIATIATTGFAAVHFQRVALYGVLANLLAVPITAFWIMPAGLFAMLLMPFGLEAWAFSIMGEGIAIVLAIARRVAALPGASLATPPLPPLVLPLIAFGGLWLCLWRGSWRRWGLYPMAAGVLLAFSARSPDVLIAEGGLGFAIKDGKGGMYIEARRRDGYRDEVWSRTMNASSTVQLPQRGVTENGFARCDPQGCAFALEDRLVTLARSPSAVSEDCKRADIVIVLSGADQCANATLSIGPQTLWRENGISIAIGDGTPEIRFVRMERGLRPWSRD